MEWRPGGFSNRDHDDGFRILESREDLRARLEDTPVLRSPMFHSRVRAHVSTMRSEGIADAAFELRYDELFRLQHERAHRGLLVSVAGSPPATGMHRQSPLLSCSPFFAAVQHHMRGRCPPPPNAPLTPSALNNDSLSVTFGSSCGTDEFGIAPLPHYEPTRGMRWNATVVRCAKCEQEAVVVRPHFVDLVARPELRTAVAQGPLTWHSCPRCGTSVGWPLFVWVSEGEAPDPLNALATIVRAREDMLIYCPPEGTRREPDLERVLEIRSEHLERVLQENVRAKTKHMTIGFAYDTGELSGLLERAAEPDGLPLAMWALVTDFAQKLERGEASPTDCEAHLREMEQRVQPDWPIALASGPPMAAPFLFLTRSLVAEMCARRNGAPTETHAFIAFAISQGYLALGYEGIAESHLSRANELARSLGAGPQRSHLLIEIDSARAEILVKSGNHVGAATILSELVAQHQTLEDSFASRVSLHELGAYLGLALFRAHHCDAAFARFQHEIPVLEELIVEAGATADGHSTEWVYTLQHSLSAALANWATLLLELADHVAATPEARARDVTMNLSRKEMTRVSAALAGATSAEDARERLSLALPVGSIRRLATLDETLQLYRSHFGCSAGEDDPMLPIAIRESARWMYERALTIAESIGSWNHAGRQAKKLAFLAQRAGHSVAVESLMNKVLDYATRGSDQESALTARQYFAGKALGAMEGATALAHVREAAREFIRWLVSQGHLVEDDETSSRLANLALRCVNIGGDPSECIVVVESLRAVALGVSMARGTSFLADEPRETRDRLQRVNDARGRLQFRLADDPQQEHDLRPKLERLDDVAEGIRRAAYVRDPRYAQWCDATALDISDAGGLTRSLRSRRPRTAYVGFVADQGRRIWVYAIWEKGSLVVERPWPQLEPTPSASSKKKGDPIHWFLEDANEETASPLHSEGTACSLDSVKVGALSETLLEPLRHLLTGDDPVVALILSVQSPFDTFPFAALSIGGRRLCELVEISHVQGAGVFHACERRPLAGRHRSLCVGNPRREGETDLPSAAEEADRVSQLFRGSGGHAETLIGSDASIDALRSLASESDVLHFACHAGGESPDDPLPALLLSRDGEDDGALSSERILREVRLRPGCLVNLSACESASQSETTGPRAGGLVPAFLIVGAGSVLATLWSVYDNDAAAFNAAFYERLLSGSTPAAALAAVQRECITGRLGSRVQLPEVWGAFALFGSGR